MIQGTHSAQILQKQNICNIYVIIKTMCPPGITKIALWQLKSMSYHKAIVVIITERAHCFRDYIYIYIYIYIYQCISE